MELGVVAGRYRKARSGLCALVCILSCIATAEPEQKVDLEALRGHGVYLDFWASWCAPCRQSFPWMEEMSKAHQAEGLEVIAVNVDRERADADRFLKQFH